MDLVARLPGRLELPRSFQGIIPRLPTARTTRSRPWRRGGRLLQGRLGGLVEGPGDDRLSRLGHYHGPGGLDGRVRNGNGYGSARMVAGKAAGGCVATPAAAWVFRGRLIRVCSRAGSSLPMSLCRGVGSTVCVVQAAIPTAARGAPRFVRGGGSGWSSRLAVRTGRLRRSPAVHVRPIDLVVFQEPMHSQVREV